MKIMSMTMINHSDPSGTLEVQTDRATTRIQLTEPDAQQVLYLAERISTSSIK